MSDDAAAIADQVWRAIGAGDWETARALLHDDFVQEWPQSGERIVGRDDALAVNQNFPGGLPRMTMRRVLADGNLAVAEMGLEYADGSRFQSVSVFELRDGKIVRETDYFAEPFTPPGWRAQWVQRM
jgi:ketosteroid isomerase-like protein